MAIFNATGGNDIWTDGSGDDVATGGGGGARGCYGNRLYISFMGAAQGADGALRAEWGAL